jgi:hypothetical protein
MRRESCTLWLVLRGPVLSSVEVCRRQRAQGCPSRVRSSIRTHTSLGGENLREWLLPGLLGTEQALNRPSAAICSVFFLPRQLGRQEFKVPPTSSSQHQALVRSTDTTTTTTTNNNTSQEFRPRHHSLNSTASLRPHAHRQSLISHRRRRCTACFNAPGFLGLNSN